MNQPVTIETLREWAAESGGNERRELRQVIGRLEKVVRQQGKENRRLNNAYKRLKEEKRSTYVLQVIAEELQEEVESLADQVEFYESGRVGQAERSNKRSKEALGVRYAHLHRALTGLIAGTVSSEEAQHALADVASRKWLREQMSKSPTTGRTGDERTRSTSDA